MTAPARGRATVWTPAELLSFWGGLVTGGWLAWQWYHLFLDLACGTARCGPAGFGAVLPVVAGTALAVALATGTGSPFPFVPALAAPALGALGVANADAPASVTRPYLWFGLVHLTVLIALAGLSPTARRARRLRAAWTRGEAAFATVREVADAGGVAEPFVRLRVRALIDPLTVASPPYDAEQVVVMPRDAVPRPGERIPVWLDERDRTRWFPAGELAERALPTSARVLGEVARRGTPHRRRAVVTVDAAVAALRELNADRRAGKLDDETFARRADELLRRD